MSDSGQSKPPDALISKDVGMKYWEGIDADVNGMLGGVPMLEGFSSISKVDLQGSRNFLAKLGIGKKAGQRVVADAVEGGAGIGRVTTGLLLNVAKQVDVIEPVVKFTAELQGKTGVRNIFNVGLQDWIPADGARYDLIWLQWCVGHLTDEQLVQFLERCQLVLDLEGGVIVIKENISTSEVDIYDSIDSSVTREDRKFLSIFKQAGLRVVRMELQKGFSKTFPEKLFPVMMYALKPEALLPNQGEDTTQQE